MIATSLDTHRIVKRLTDAGLSEKTAETVTDVLRESREADLSPLATKQDLDALRVATKNDFDALRIATKNDFDALRIATRQDLLLLEQRLGERIGKIEGRVDLLAWMVGTSIAFNAGILAKLLFT